MLNALAIEREFEHVVFGWRAQSYLVCDCCSGLYSMRGTSQGWGCCEILQMHIAPASRFLFT